MAKIFGAKTDEPIIVKAGKAIVTVDNKTMLALGVTVQFQRGVQIIPTLGDKRVLSIGIPQGTFTCNTIIAKDVDPTTAFHLNDDGCKPFDMTIKFNDSACEMSGKTITIKQGVASAVSIDAQGERGYIGSGINVTFIGMEM